MIVSCDFRHPVRMFAVVVVEDQAAYESFVVVME